MWDNVAEVIDAFERDDFVKVKGLMQVFHNRPQLTIHKLRRMDDSEIEFTDYFPSSERNPEEMWQELREVVASISNPHLKALLEAMLNDEDIAQRYKRAPAAKSIHHAFLGGLIEHVLSLCTLAKLAAGHYRHVDRDLLLTGVVLHDIGKIYELNYDRGISYSTDGQLIGHIDIAMRMVADKLHGLPDFPPRLRSLVEHMILSHHGHLEFGSPKVPQFPEALLLHYLDDMDSKMECMRALIVKDRQIEGCFTSFNAALERPALKMDRYWEDAPAPKRPPSSPVADFDNGSGKTVPVAQPIAPPTAAVHPLFAPRTDSPFAGKLKEALSASPPAAPRPGAEQER
jgi:3'-5' exoribonuclease